MWGHHVAPDVRMRTSVRINTSAVSLRIPMLLVWCVPPLFLRKKQQKSHDAVNEQNRLKTKRVALWLYFAKSIESAVAVWVYYAKCIVGVLQVEDEARCIVGVWNGNHNSDTDGGQRKIGVPLRQCSAGGIYTDKLIIACSIYLIYISWRLENMQCHLST